MQRKKNPQDNKEADPEKDKMKEIINSLSKNWNAEERETSILFDHSTKRVHLETSYPSTARRWFRNLWGDPNVNWDGAADTLKFSIPQSYCRKADLIIKAKHREYSG